MVCNGLIQRAFAPPSHRLSTIPPLELLALVVVFALLLPIGVLGSAATDFLTMPAFGRTDFTVGQLYNLPTDTTIPYKLWDEAYIANYTFIERVNREQYKFATGDSYSAAWDMFDMSAELKMSFMCGLLSIKGSAALFKEKCSTYLTQRVSMLWQRESAWKSIRMEALFEHPERMYRKVLETGATHVVIKILYGASYTLSFEAAASNEADASKIAGSLDVVVRSIPSFAIEGKASLELSESEQRVANSLTVRSSGDIILPAPVTSYDSAKQTCQNLGKYFKQTFGIGDDGMASGGGNPGNPLIVVMAPLKDFISDAQKLMYKISDDIVNEAVDVVERMDDILKRCNTKMEYMDDRLMGAFPRLTKEMQSFYNLVNEFKQKTERGIQALLPKLRSGFEDELRLSELVSEARRRLDLANPDEFLSLKKQETELLRGILDMLPHPIDDGNHGGCELTKNAEDWVTVTSFDDDQTVAIVLDFPLNQFLKPMRSVLMDATFNETAMSLLKLRPLSLSASTINRFKRIRSFVERNKDSLRSVFIDRISFPLLDVPAISDTLKFHFYSGGAVLCPAFYAPTAPTLFSVDLPTYNSTLVNLTWLAPSSCPRPTGFTIQITSPLKNKTVDMTFPSTASMPNNVSFAVDVADMAQQGLSYGFNIRSRSAAGVSEWSNEIFVVLQPTPAPVGLTADWNYVSSTIANLTILVGVQGNQIAELRRQLDQYNTTMSNSISRLESRLARYDNSVVLQHFIDEVLYYVSKGYRVFYFPNLRVFDILSSGNVYIGGPFNLARYTPDWLVCCH